MDGGKSPLSHSDTEEKQATGLKGSIKTNVVRRRSSIAACARVTKLKKSYLFEEELFWHRRIIITFFGLLLIYYKIFTSFSSVSVSNSLATVATKSPIALNEL